MPQRVHSSNEPGELSQWLCHDDSTINIVLDIYRLQLDVCNFSLGRRHLVNAYEVKAGIGV